MNKLNTSLLLKVFFTALIIIIAFSHNKRKQAVIWSDMEGYYVYLPSTFIYGGFVKEAVRDTNYLRPWQGNGEIFTKYTSGVAILESPFFFSAHLLSKPLGFPSDGHSLIYCYALMLAAIFYMLAGMQLLYNTITTYYDKSAAMLALGGLFLGTNLYYYTIFQPSMSHVYSFFLFAALVFLTEKVVIKQQTTLKWFLLAGLTAGLIVLVRPTSAIVLLYPVYRWVKTTPEKWTWVTQHRFKLLLAILAGAVVFIPQFIYWKHVTGEWFMWSYGDETFKYWKEPKLFRVLFDAWNGWLLYSPIAAIPLLALFLGRHSNQHGERIIMVILAIATYLFASWWAWWFGGAFGHRSYVEYYALLALPFASMAQLAFKKTWSKVLILAICALLIYYNLGLTYHYNPPWDGPEWTYEKVWIEIGKLF